MSGNKVRALVGFNRKVAEMLTVAPAGWVSSREVAAALGVQVRSARSKLNRAAVRHVLVKRPGDAPGLFWAPEGVRRLVNSMSQPVHGLPTGWCSFAEAGEILGVARSSLYRFVKEGRLEARKVRVQTSTGVRPMMILKRQQVRGLARRRKAGERTRRQMLRMRSMRVRRALE